MVRLREGGERSHISLVGNNHEGLVGEEGLDAVEQGSLLSYGVAALF